MLPLTPSEVLVRGTRYLSGQEELHEETQSNIKKFKSHYGATPNAVAQLWSDILESDEISETDKCEQGFRRILVAIHFLWAYPKNGDLLASATGLKLRQVQGENLWRYVAMIASLKTKKFVWPEKEYNDPKKRILIVSVDGTDFRTWEPKHPTKSLDTGVYSHKFAHAALKYEIAIDTLDSKVVWINGPFRGGMGDGKIYTNALEKKIPKGKMVVCDGGYIKGAKPDRARMALPNPCDDPDTSNYKSRLRLRHETFNGRIKAYNSMYATFRHGSAKHKHAFEAVCVMCQITMDLGSTLYDA